MKEAYKLIEWHVYVELTTDLSIFYEHFPK